MTIAEITDCLGLAPMDADRGETLVKTVVTDSKQVSPGSLFVCIAGARVDGHDFAEEAVKNGAAAILAEKELPDLAVPVIVAQNTVAALGKLASCWRNKTEATVVGITGTAGKTTVKEILAHVLEARGKTAKSRLNHNNQIGLPLSILETDGDEKFWVMEAGISHAGDMDDLGSILRPDLGLVLNAGPGHLEGLGAKGVAWNKARLFKYLKQGGHAVICADYPDLVREAQKYEVDLAQFSSRQTAPGSDASEVRWGITAEDGENCELDLNGEKCVVKLPMAGEAGKENSLAVAVVASLLGLSPAEISVGFAGVNLPEHRFHEEIVGSWHIIDDTYNANPLSMIRMLHAAKIKADKLDLPFYAVLGEMRELGGETGRLHAELGTGVADLNPDFVFFKGDNYQDFVNGYSTKNKDGSTKVFSVDELAQFKDSLEKTVLQPGRKARGGVILFKGSRANNLEKYSGMFKEIIAQPD